MSTINVGVIGTGWCGGMRAETAADSPLVGDLHISEVNEDRLKEVQAKTGAVTATTDYRDILAIDDVDAVLISATPETLHYPMTKEAFEAGKHVLLEKPIALTLAEADELIELADARGLKFTIGYSQRFNDKQALVKRSIDDGTLGEPISALVSRHITRKLGDKIGGRILLSPAAMETTHDIDWLLWCLEPRRAVRVYGQAVEKVMKPKYGTQDMMSIIVTLDDGTVLNFQSGWMLPPGWPNYSSTWIEVFGSEGVLILDDSHRDTVLHTMSDGTQFPLSTMPGEQAAHVYAGPMHEETLHFIDAVARDREVLCKPDEARRAMEVYLAADLSAYRNEPVDLPLTREEEKAAIEVGIKEA